MYTKMFLKQGLVASRACSFGAEITVDTVFPFLSQSAEGNQFAFGSLRLLASMTLAFAFLCLSLITLDMRSCFS